MINFFLNWHPQFFIQSMENCGALFLSETDQFLLDENEFIEIDELVRIGGRLSDYVFSKTDVAEQVKRITRIDKLIEEKILFMDKGQADYFLPRFEATPTSIEFAHTKAFNLSALINDETIEHWLRQVDVTSQICFVFVDDYLDPRLIALSEKMLAQGLGWLLVKPLGQKPILGPYFLGKEESDACYHCLLHRLQQNQPVREWFRRRVSAERHSAIPVLFNEKHTEKYLSIFSKLLNQALCDQALMSTRVITLEGSESNVTSHPFNKRPQCSSCGDIELFTTENHSPIFLQDITKHKDIDGGYRKLSRDETIGNMQKIISPVTGIISNISDISHSVRDDSMSIFRAAYYQNTYGHDKISADTFVQLSLGKGISDQQAMSSALGEALERQAAQYTGEETCIYSTETNLPHRAFSPLLLTQFSEQQFREFELINGVNLANPQWIKKSSPNTPLHWTRGWSFKTNDFVYFPAAFCFANTPFDDHVYSLYTHNGNAAGSTKEEAILQGVLELIERDAAAIWWYNRIPRPEVSLSIIPKEPRQKIAATLDEHWHYWLLDVSNNIDVYSCVAVGQHKKTDGFVIGFGCHLDPSVACQRALTEMYQLITIKDKVTGPFDFHQLTPQPYLFPKRGVQEKTITDFSVIETNSIKEDILYVAKALHEQGLEMCVVNYSRPDIPLKTLKVIVPHLCHFWPQLANSRLYTVPVDLAWLSNSLSEDELNPLPLYL